VPGLLRHRGELRRKAPQLPCYVEVPAALVAPWKIAATTVVDASINGVAIGRRTLKPWGDGKRWFIELTGPHCRKLGIETGDDLELRLERADETPPAELLAVLEASAGANQRWQRMSPSQRRVVCEQVRAAKRPDTRRSRASRFLDY
jgi:hypothetical protein